MEILKSGDTGTYEELSAMENTDNLVIAYNPPIEALLERARQLKGGFLSESEENRIRKNSPAIALPKDVYDATYG